MDDVVEGAQFRVSLSGQGAVEVFPFDVRPFSNGGHAAHGLRHPAHGQQERVAVVFVDGGGEVSGGKLRVFEQFVQVFFVIGHGICVSYTIRGINRKDSRIFVE